MPGQKAQQGKLFRGQLQPCSGTKYAASQQVEMQIVNLQLGDVRAIRSAAAHQGLNTRHQLNQREGLGQIIIRAKAKPFNAFIDRAASRKHQHRRLFGSSHTLKYPVTIHPRQHHIQYYRVVVELQRVMKTFSAICRDINRKPGLTQRTGEIG